MLLLASELSGQGHDVLVVALRGGGEFQHWGSRNGVRIDAVSGTRWWVIRAPLLLPRVIRNFRPDVIYGFLTVGNVWAALLGLWFRDSRVVFGVRNAERADNDPIGMRPLFRLEALLARRVDAVIANSDVAANWSIHRRGFDRARVHVVENGIDLDVFRFDTQWREELRREWGVGETNTLVGRIGNLRPAKDYPTFLRAAALVAASRADVRFVCVGGGPSELQDELARQARHLGLGDRVIWTGQLDAVERVYSALDLSVSSSVSESSPNVVGESMACGVPCVTTDVGNAASIVQDPTLVVPPGDPNALARAVCEAIARLEAEGKEWGRQLRESVEQRLSPRRMAEETLAIVLAAE